MPGLRQRVLLLALLFPVRVLAASFTSPEITESSGLVASRTHPGVVWTVNDSGNAPALHAATEDGSHLARYRIAGVFNRDFETLDIMERNGVPTLVVGDTGDNRARRKDVRLIGVPEPNPLKIQTGTLIPSFLLPFRYPDGATDVEAMAVDETAGRFLLMTKREKPTRIFTLPFPEDGENPMQLATRLGFLPLSLVTGLSIRKDGREMAILTYGRLHLYANPDRLPWESVLSTTRPDTRPIPCNLYQPEGIGHLSNGDILISSERKTPTLCRMPSSRVIKETP